MKDIRRFRCGWKKGYGMVYMPDGPFVEWQYVEPILQERRDLLKRFNELKRYLTKFLQGVR